MAEYKLWKQLMKMKVCKLLLNNSGPGDHGSDDAKMDGVEYVRNKNR